LLENNFSPVICPPAITADGEIINVDGDRVASILAIELKAKKLVFLTGAPGFLKNPDDEKSLISHIDKTEIEKYFEFAKGRMRKKILAIKEAIEGGVEEIYIGDGRIKNPITKVLQGKGTIIS
jgi:acetylglutamate/LysW-gamma-L-alpha-aminoadipate kinase